MSYDLIINYSNPKTWHVQDKKPDLTSGEKLAIESLQASGHELDAIRAQFENIPIVKGSFCIWRGEMAKFIFLNLH